MKTKYLLVAIFCSMIVLVSGCRTSPVKNIEDQNIVASSSDYTEDDVKKAIVVSGAGLGWNMKADKPGHILGTLNIRDHMAMVDIKYDLKSYSITYKDSSNLKYDATGGEAVIHSNYNGWIENLDRSIKASLNSL